MNLKGFKLKGAKKTEGKTDSSRRIQLRLFLTISVILSISSTFFAVVAFLFV